MRELAWKPPSLAALAIEGNWPRSKRAQSTSNPRVLGHEEVFAISLRAATLRQSMGIAPELAEATIK